MGHENGFLQISQDDCSEDFFLEINILGANLGDVRVTIAKIMAATCI